MSFIPGNPFRRHRALSPPEYQKHVLNVVRKQFPSETFEATDEPLMVRCGESQLGLHNLYSEYLRDRLANRSRDRSIREHFARMVANLTVREELEDVPWAEIQARIRPQFMPSEYTDIASLVTFPFTDEVLIALVIDSPETYAYVTVEESQKWGQPASALYDIAIANLDAASAGTKMHVSAGPDRCVGVEANDGYNAARLLLPGIRAAAVEHLDSPCFAVIPNRDFLFFWATDSSPSFQANVRQNAKRDRQIQPYPLTDAVFAVTVDAIAPSAS
jgi:hypothetical protein